MLQKLTKSERVILNSYASECFQNVADGDYISARALYRIGCIEQFFWYSQQALEKYMKGILLFNKIEHTKSNHNLPILFDKISGIKILNENFEFPEQTKELLKYFNKNGDTSVRYRQKPLFSGFHGCDLETLDSIIFYIRRYCQVIVANYSSKLGVKNENIIKAKLKQLSLNNINKNWKQALLCGGKLEQLLNASTRKSPQREILIWKNLYFGNGKVRQKQATIPHYCIATTPALYRRPQNLALLKKYILIPKAITNKLK